MVSQGHGRIYWSWAFLFFSFLFFSFSGLSTVTQASKTQLVPVMAPDAERTSEDGRTDLHARQLNSLAQSPLVWGWIIESNISLSVSH